MFSNRHKTLIIAFAFATPVLGVFISNLSESCGRCLCEGATACNVTIGCVGGYCGPFHISRVFWVDAGRVVLPDDDPDRDGAYQDCASDYYCGLRIVAGYLQKYARDCNGDELVDCEDYVMIHYNGGVSCEKLMHESRFYRRYAACHQDSCESSSSSS